MATLTQVLLSVLHKLASPETKGSRSHPLQHIHGMPFVPLQVDEMCAYLKIDPEEDAYVKEVAHMAISAPLPDGWEEAEDEQGGAAFR